MSTYNNPTDAVAGSLVRVSAVNAVDAAAAAAFALLPTETNLSRGTVNFATDTGAVDAYVVTLPQVPSGYVDGLLVVMLPIHTNTGACTINVNSLGVKSIKRKDSTAPGVGDIRIGIPVEMRYSTTTGYFHLLDSDTTITGDGTVWTTLPVNGIVYGNGISGVGCTAIGAEGQILRVGAAPLVPAWSTATFADTYAVGTILHASTANIVTGLTAGAAGTLLTSNGAAVPIWTSGAAIWMPTTGTFTATPASTSTLTMTTDMTASIKVGMSLQYVIGGTTYYGRVAAITAGLLTVNGAPLSGDVTSLKYGGGKVSKIIIVIPAAYEDASNTALISSDLRSSALKTWDLPVSYLVHFKVHSDTVDTGTKGQASVRINNTEVCTTAGGLTLTAAQTEYSTVVNIAIAAYDINPGEAVEITAVKAGNGDAADLTVEMIFVTP